MFKNQTDGNNIVSIFIFSFQYGSLKNGPDRSASILTRIPEERWGTPENFKGITLFLASDAAIYVSGTIVTVDGGWMGR